MFSLKNKVAFVIGGNGLIGSGISCALAKQGAEVIVAARSNLNNDDIKEKFKKNNIKTIIMDASKENEVKSSIEEIEKSFGVINILVNCSAWRPTEKYMDDTAETWEASIKVNSSAIFFPSRLIGKKMEQNGGGSIINISSIYGIVAPPMRLYDDCDFETEPDYPFLKAGTIGLTKFLSSYFAKSNVRVNAIAPGGVENNQPKSFTDKYNYFTPMGRMAKVEDIVGSVIFLASDESSYITGVTLPVDGGWSAI